MLLQTDDPSSLNALDRVSHHADVRFSHFYLFIAKVYNSINIDVGNV